ncbi:MAG: neuraminidase-like domain-containing protein [Terracidiphilus sp.]|jgi:hypothetical protein
MSSYIVIRLVPDSPVDGGTFSTYLDGLQIQVYPAGALQVPANLLGETQIVTSNITLAQVPWLPTTYVASVSKLVETGTALVSSGNYGTTLTLEDANGVAYASVVTCAENTGLFNSNTEVTKIPAAPPNTEPTITLSGSIPSFVAAGTVVTFFFAYGPGSIAPSSPTIDVNFGGNNPSFSFVLNTSAASSTKTVKFSSTDGIAVGMQVTAASGVPASTQVTAVTATSITVNNTVSLGNGDAVTFTSSLSAGIVQHIEQIPEQAGFLSYYVPIPASVATAIIPLNPSPAAGTYADISVVATRTTASGPVTLPMPSAFYNVLVTQGAPPAPDQYQGISLSQTSLYIALPPPPNPNTVSLTIPTDGSAPNFDALIKAMKLAIANDPTYFTGPNDISALSVDDCTRLAYDIMWSQQNTLPAPPDPLESLYTNPPNPGGSTSSSSSSSTNNLEQDRQKFEGTLNSFYSIPNATAERLVKFVAAASVAVFCEQTSLNSTAALVEFPVDPSSSFAGAVESELLVQGIGINGNTNINFGVPAAFFYALGANLDKSTTAAQRYQMATGDVIERLLQQFATAESALSISDSEAFQNTGLGLANITSFQAARRLVALGVSAASNSPSVTLVAPSPLASIIGDWLSAVDPTPTPAPNPPLTYQNIDFNLWTQKFASDYPLGYLYLDLDALTQGYILPPLAASPLADAASGSTLTFAALTTAGNGVGIGVGMPVAGTNIAPGTTVKAAVSVTTVTLSAGLAPGGVSTSTVITFTAGSATIAASPNETIASGTTLTFVATAGTAGISAGATVGGTGIAPNTTVLSSSTVTTVTLSSPLLAGGVTTSTTLEFNGITATTTADCPNGSNLTFGGAGGTSGISAGMVVLGPNIVPGTTVKSVASPTVTLSAPVAADVPSGSVITFAINPSTLADQIAAWLPSTTNPPTPNPTVGTLKQVTAAEWTNFFTFPGNQSWLPPFTQPIAPGASPGQVKQKAGYVALRIRAFIRAVQQFFTVSSVATSAQLPLPGAPPIFALPSYDPISLAVSSLPSGFKFGNSISSSDLTSAVQNVFATDLAAQAWLAQAITTINELFEIASVVTNPAGASQLPNPVSFSFCVAEALYARGFRGASDITRLAGADFQQAMTGTVAYDFANSGSSSIYAKAQSMAPNTPPSGQTGGSFQPINPDGWLVNCVPPPCLSPTGPIAYLQEMLELSQASTCSNPWAAPAKGQSTLGDAVSARRGPLGSLLASEANLETPLPLIDLVNECLEYLGSTQPAAAGTTQPAPSGTVYNTSADSLAGHLLCKEEDCRDKADRDCHAPTAIFAALPEYSTPATPVKGKNDSVEPLVYNNLKVDFSSCNLPYSQALDESRTYLRSFGSCRFEELRTFRKCITEFALDPCNPPAGFEPYLWRYPVRIDTAIEYLGITPEEYSLLFNGTAPQACMDNWNQYAEPASAGVTAAQLYGYPQSDRDESWSDNVVVLSEFLCRTCLSYCEFLELWKSGIAQSNKDTDQSARAATYPECEPCCLENYRLQIPDGEGREPALLQLAVFIRLWRKLKDVCGAGYTFDQLYDICTVLKLFNGATVNPEFIRQLAAFQILRDHFHLPLTDSSDRATGTTGADRTHLLALWVGSGAKKWNWAIARLLEGVESHARQRYGCERRRGEGTRHMAENLDALSRLAGFNPSTPASPSTDTWNSSPGCTLRFAEVLAKISASDFGIGELLYLFNAPPPEDCHNPFPLQEPEEALNYPLDLPDNDREHSLWRLRETLLRVEVGEEEAGHWTWPRLVAEMRGKFGYAPPSGQDTLLSIGQHFFPEVLEASGFSVSIKDRQYRTALTSTTAWNAPPGSPFQYDSSSGELWIELPLGDEAVASKLSQLPQLNEAEQSAVQDLYFAPRADLASLAFLFPDWQSAEKHLIEEGEELKRWSYFRRQFALANARRKVIAEHLAGHVSHGTGCHREGLEEVAELVLSSLLSDENTGTPWDSDTGTPPAELWTPLPSGGAIAALLGLTGTGLLGEYQAPLTVYEPDATAAPGGTGNNCHTVWREVRGPLEAFGHERDRSNSPVPTILPSLGLSVNTNPLVALNNGYAVRSGDGLRLGGAGAVCVRWSGVLLVEGEGEYAFRAGAPTGDGEEPDFKLAERSKWRVTLKRGQKSWVVLNHQWTGDTDPERSMPRLRSGAYQIVVEFSQPAPDFTASPLHPQHTGFQLKYAGPDTEGRLITLPVRRLYRDFQDQTLDQGISFNKGSRNAQAFLKALYTSTLRDMRRTYQRAYKAVLFAGKLGLSARESGEGRSSELGYMLANPVRFAGYAYYRTSSTEFKQHLVDFDFDFLPLTDNYHAPAVVAGDRSDPLLQQTQAMFDWWERIFDYDLVRKAVERVHKGQLWQLFYEAQVNPPSGAGQLLRHIGADPKYWNLDLRYWQDQSASIYTVSCADLEDERWLVRVWHADRWLQGLSSRFHSKDLSKARPDLWAAQDPSSPTPALGAPESGNANLSAFLLDGSLEDGEPRRYLEVKRLNDGLRERGRNALISYLCHQDRVALSWVSTTAYATVPRDLSDLLLLDVESGLCEKASRIEEAITAVQTFIRRSRLGLEPDWKVSREFARLWDSRFESYRAWERCKRRELYCENWVEWDELGKARHIDAFRFLESQLRSSTLTMAAPGGLDWWADDEKSLEHAPELLQRRIPSELQALAPPPESVTREGLATLGTPEYAGQPTWLAAVPQTSPAASESDASTTPASALLLAQAASVGVAPAQAEAQSLPFWMESAMKLGTNFVRVAAAGVPQAALRFEPHGDEPKSGCCNECGCDHPILVDEYYFWLINTQFYSYSDDTDAQNNPDVSFSGSYQFGFQDSYYDPYQQQSAEWNDEDSVPPLLGKWQPNPAVRLAWCRVHNGQFQQPRRSQDYVAIDEPADLVLLGRAGDSLYFQVTGSAPLAPGYGGNSSLPGDDTSLPGFRYDLPTDQSVALPQLAKPPAPATVYPGGLLSYPFYAYDQPGARLFPDSWFSPSLLVAEALRTHCDFELALRWLSRAFNPLDRDCAWMHCPDGSAEQQPTDQAIAVTGTPGQTDGGTGQQGACCDSSRVSEQAARNRTLTLRYCQMLVEWGDALMRRRRSPEAFQQARLLYDTAAKITGRRPRTILLEAPKNPQPVTSFVAAYPPLNPRLLDLYSLVYDRLGLIHECLDARRLHNGRLNHDMLYFGDSPLREGWRTVPESCAERAEWCSRPNPYRFTFQIQKATEMAGRVRELGSALLAAYEKGDAEALASIRAGQELEMLELAIGIRQDQWRDADWQIQALQQTKDLNQTNLLYYNSLYQNGLINDEIQNLTLATNAMQTKTSANITEAIGEAMTVIPDFFVGAMSTFSQIPSGTKLAGLFQTIAKVMQTVGEIQATNAAIDMTQAGWDRRSVDWFHQMQTLPIEIQQIELQILGAQRRRDQAMQELNNQQRQIEHATEIQDFLRDKFTATDLYLWLQKETAALHSRMYELAYHAAHEAERAYNFERGHTTRQFIAAETWDNLHQGLMAGERLGFALSHMERAYLNENVREYELTKHFSLRLYFPMEFLRLKVTGRCEIELPEWMFDLDYPGQYMRRIKNVTLTLPCVTGPYTGVHCRATLLSSVTRIDPLLEAPADHCCCRCNAHDGYEACMCDPRVVRTYAAREAIATSSGQNDSGLFELNFRDERYLPFEFQGAVSRWRIELPPENNYFDMETLSDLVLHLNYTAREGGEMLRRVASEAAQKHLPGSGWCLFDVRHEFSDAWHLLQSSSRERRSARLGLQLARWMFPFVPGAGEVSISKMAILFSGPDHEICNRPKAEECPCPQEGRPDCRVLEFTRGCHDRHEKPLHVSCIASEEWPDLYCGVFDTEVGPLGRTSEQSEVGFRFPAEIGEVERVFLLCRYQRSKRSC